MSEVFVCYSQKEITPKFLEIYKEDIELIGLVCIQCGKKLQVGDYADGFYPYEIEYNICKECNGGE